MSTGGSSGPGMLGFSRVGKATLSGTSMLGLRRVSKSVLSGRSMRGRWVRRDRRMRQVHGPRSRRCRASSQPCTRSFVLLLRPLLTELMHLGNLLANMLTLGFVYALEPHAPFSGQPVERHRHVTIDRDIALDQASLLDVRARRPHRDVVAPQDVVTSNLCDPAWVLPNVNDRVIRE
jgi:hypothetical protein